MKHVRVCVVGSTLFAETVAQMLFGCETVNQLDCFPSVAQAFDLMAGQAPDMLILVDIDRTALVRDAPFLSICSDVPVVCASHDSTTLKVITTTRVSARLPELIGLIAALKDA